MDIANIHDILGKVKHRSGEGTGAIREHAAAARLFRRVVEQDPKNAEARNRLLRSLRILNRLTLEEGNMQKASEYRREIDALEGQRST